MDVLSLIGLILGIGAILFGNFLDGGHISMLGNVAAFIIVIGGTLGAMLLQTTPQAFKHSMSLTKWIFIPPLFDFERGIEQIMFWSTTARKEGLLGLEGMAEAEADPFARKGLQLLVDGAEPDSIRHTMEMVIDLEEHRDMSAGLFWEGLGGYAPTIGIIGAVLGLIHVMTNLGEPELLGQGIATAFVATIYGVGSANLLFLPIGGKIKSVVMTQTEYKQMIVEGLVGISEGENPKAIASRLNSFIEE
ncbi:flagellar motor protein [Litoribacillus peritrichatus]|uniref:Flagellar motor protein n=1 Tax=Litoribacillus peritrichatus TaxID=718191 RepID=A0ABP7M5D4_9GAMM